AEQSPEPRAPKDTQPIAASTIRSETTAAEVDDASAVRRKRPPRVLRTGTTEEAGQDEELAGENGGEGEAESAGAGASTGVALARPSVPDSEEDEDVASPSAATTAEAYAAPSRWDPDGFSWPLPLSIIKGGRYRVEAVVSVAADETGENVYRVRDL